MSHRSLSNVIPYAAAIFALEAYSRMLHVASISLDASLLELFARLMGGACVVMVALEQAA